MERSPKKVQHYHDYLQAGLPHEGFITYRRAYIRNIAYSFQYLEHLSESINDQLHPVIHNQIIKNFIVTGCGIVESILWMLLRADGLNQKGEWEIVQQSKTNPHVVNGVEHRYEITEYKKLDTPVDIEMRFIDLCRKAEKKGVLGVSSSVYAKLNHLRQLRNRVHIHSVQHDRDNDWWTFDLHDGNLMREVLLEILKSQVFSPHAEYEKMFGWLKINESTKDIANDTEQVIISVGSGLWLN